jgi:hypothetical protein
MSRLRAGSRSFLLCKNIERNSSFWADIGMVDSRLKDNTRGLKCRHFDRKVSSCQDSPHRRHSISASLLTSNLSCHLKPQESVVTNLPISSQIVSFGCGVRSKAQTMRRSRVWTRQPRKEQGKNQSKIQSSHVATRVSISKLPANDARSSAIVVMRTNHVVQICTVKIDRMWPTIELDEPEMRPRIPIDDPNASGDTQFRDNRSTQRVTEISSIASLCPTQFTSGSFSSNHTP